MADNTLLEKLVTTIQELSVATAQALDRISGIQGNHKDVCALLETLRNKIEDIKREVDKVEEIRDDSSEQLGEIKEKLSNMKEMLSNISEKIEEKGNYTDLVIKELKDFLTSERLRPILEPIVETIIIKVCPGKDEELKEACAFVKKTGNKYYWYALLGSFLIALVALGIKLTDILKIFG
ncbi:MAG: hypothetical protein AABY32_02250 [Nanoarchaeota archaeon]